MRKTEPSTVVTGSNKSNMTKLLPKGRPKVCRIQDKRIRGHPVGINLFSSLLDGKMLFCTYYLLVFSQHLLSGYCLKL